jgi:hypothetical protein
MQLCVLVAGHAFLSYPHHSLKSPACGDTFFDYITLNFPVPQCREEEPVNFFKPGRFIVLDMFEL